MASRVVDVKVTVEPNIAGQIPEEDTEVVILGGGICGVLTGQKCADEGTPYLIVEREADFGGVWATLANDYSSLQVAHPQAICFNLGLLCSHGSNYTP